MSESTLGLLPLHIPVRTKPKHLPSRDGKSTVVAICSCGEEGPPVALPTTWPPSSEDYAGDPCIELARHHGYSEPAVCEDCGHPTPVDPRQDRATQYPWRRYSVERRDGRWTYVCLDRGACHQRQLAPIVTEDEVGDPVRWIDPPLDTVNVSLDISALDIENGQLSLTPAIALFQTARAVSPRSWGEVEPKDERALTALATGVFALQVAADDAQRYVVIAARKAGASWEDLAAATGSWSGEELRDWYVKTQHANYDWPLELHAEICRLLEPDPTDDEEQ